MIEIRKATDADAKEISENVKESVLATHRDVYSQDYINHVLWLYGPEKVKEFINDHIFWVAQEDNEIVGSIALRPHKGAGTGFMTALYISPKHMGKGLGRMLVDHLEKYGKDNGYEEIWLWSSIVAKDFYSRLGYKKVQDILEDGTLTHIEMLRVL